jgi:ATP phosphoribosyltransferase
MLSIAIPKGSLEEQTLLLFKQADMEIKSEARGYNPSCDDPRLDRVKILRPQEIPTYVADAYFDLGISGLDCIREAGADVVEVADMPYAKTGAGVMRMVIAVPEESSVREPKELAAGSRITTEFPNLTRRYFEELGVPVEVFYSYGATEAKVPELMDAVVDLTETGETLRQNRLRIIGEIMQSTTKLIANPAAWADPAKRKAIEDVKTMLLGVIDARGRVLLSMNVAEDRLDDLVAALPALKFPTVSKLYKRHEMDTHLFAVETVVDKSTVNVLIPQLKEMGASDILETPIAKIVR